jgi:predicted outer membrane protein
LAPTFVNAATVAKPDDAQISNVAYYARRIDIDASRLALRTSKTRDVCDLTEKQVHHHRAAAIDARSSLEEAPSW